MKATSVVNSDADMEVMYAETFKTANKFGGLLMVKNTSTNNTDNVDDGSKGWLIQLNYGADSGMIITSVDGANFTQGPNPGEFTIYSNRPLAPDGTVDSVIVSGTY